MYNKQQKEDMKIFATIMMIPLMIVFLPVILVMAFCNGFVDFGPFKFFE